MLALPDHELCTRESRKHLRPDVPRADAVYSLQRTALLVLALAGGELDLLPRALDDRLHQPDRAALTPMFCSIQEHLPSLGAYGGTLSGAGPAMCRSRTSASRIFSTDSSTVSSSESTTTSG